MSKEEIAIDTVIIIRISDIYICLLNQNIFIEMTLTRPK